MGALTGRLADGRGRLLGATVSRTAGRWHVSFTVEVDRDIPARPSRRQRAGGTVGVDLGVRTLAVLSTGETVANPNGWPDLCGSCAARRGPTPGRSPAASARRQRAAQLARVHAG